MRAHLPLEADLARDRGTPRRARQLLTERFADELNGAELDTAKLLSSELVTNAVIYGHGKITLRADLDENRLHVEVIDQGSGFERAAKAPGFRTSVGGRGLNLVEAESSRWGIHEGTTHVWFELERSGQSTPRRVPCETRGD